MSEFKDLFGSPGMNQDCLETCVTFHTCLLYGCFKCQNTQDTKPSAAKPQNPKPSLDS